MHIDHAYHSSSVPRFCDHAVSKIAHVINLNQCVYIYLKFVDILLN